jgi:hypothetical protein
LALQAGDRDAWEAFLQAYPDGFYANLAKVQLKKIAAEETRITASEKAQQAEQEKARLAAEGARQAEQAKAAAAAKKAEEARIAAEKAKQIEQEKAAAAERARQAGQEKAAAAQQARLAVEKAAEEKKQQLAAVSPTDKPEQPAVDLPRALQAELRRVGCSTGIADGNWNAASQKALDLFNKHAGMKLDVKTASVDALDALKGKTGRICPLVCERGFKADSDRCAKITCPAGYRVNDDNECEKVPEKKPVATRDDAKKRDEQRKQVETAPAKPQATGQVICNTAGCRPVARGCRLEFRNYTGQVQAGGRPTEVCN